MNSVTPSLLLLLLLFYSHFVCVCTVLFWLRFGADKKKASSKMFSLFLQWMSNQNPEESVLVHCLPYTLHTLSFDSPPWQEKLRKLLNERSCLDPSSAEQHISVYHLLLLCLGKILISPWSFILFLSAWSLSLSLVCSPISSLFSLPRHLFHCSPYLPEGRRKERF